ncbi:MAG: family N-acetyltransferase [Flaviaesturariibacter sp.]|nr:family N-acetyltransferase [Flaviaesturariibacter sp.]
MQIDWSLKPFGDLTPQEVYDILQLRNEVFVVEQNCVFQDADGKDAGSWHLQGRRGGQLVAYTRIVPPGHIYEEASIGRVVTSPAARGTGAGKELLTKSISSLYDVCGRGAIRIGAQLYLQKFYEAFGFAQVGEPYLEDGIPHIYMIKS